MLSIESILKSTEQAQQIKVLKIYLNVSEKPEEDLALLRDARTITGSCSWIITKSYFNRWRDDLASAQILWLRARPAFGKSVLASYVVDHLNSQGYDCSYFFFLHRHPAKSKIQGFLRSIAFQMASAPANQAIREYLISLQQEGPHIDSDDDEQAIWRKVFVTGIFRTVFQRPQYWILDGLDECHQPTAIFSLLSKIEEMPMLRVLITSRDTNELLKSSMQLKSRITYQEISVQDTTQDIQAYTEEKVSQLNIDDSLACRYVHERILEKSQGCFLWVRLVLKELEDVHTRSGIEQILEEVPEGMDSLYARTLDLMSQQIHGNRDLVQAILTWTMCAIRPLTVTELQEALKLDIGESVYRLRQAITGMCSQLLCVDAKDRLQPVHETAREYLFSHSDSEWAVSKSNGSSRLVNVCLKYLTSQEMALPRNRKKPGLHLSKQEKSPFASYACTAFSEHLRTASALADPLIIILAQFLNGNILSWIEFVARNFKSLHHLTRAAKNFKIFLDRRAKYKSPLGKEFNVTAGWSIDLHRVATKFGRCILSSPSVVYWLVPVFCPSESTIRKQFGRESYGVEVIGLQSNSWDDRVSCLIFRGKAPSAIDCDDHMFAVGFPDQTGPIFLYYTSTCQESRRLNQSESVGVLRFSGSGEFLASSGPQNIYVWSPASGTLLFSFRAAYESLSLEFAPNDSLLMAAAKGAHIYSWDLSNSGKELAASHWHDADGSPISQGFPTAVVFNHERSLLAIAYKRFPASLWDVEENAFLGYCQRIPISPRNARSTASHPHIESMVFNPKTDQFLVSYADGELCCFEAWSQVLELQADVNAQTLACSPDGRTVASGDAHGTIQFRDARTLRLMYKIVAYDDPIRALVFSSNSLRLLDIRGSTCNVWEPSVLVRSEEEDDESVSEAVSRSPEIVESEDAEDMIQLTVMIPSETSTVFVGKEDGVVSIYEKASGKQAQVLYDHANGVAVSAMAWSEAQAVLVSADVASEFIVVRIVSSGSNERACKKLLERRLENQVIHKLALNRTGNHLLVSSSTLDSIYSITGDLISSRPHGWTTFPTWLNHSQNQNLLISLDSSSIRIFDWRTFEELHRQLLFDPTLDPIQESRIRRSAFCPASHKILLHITSGQMRTQKTQVYLFNDATLDEVLLAGPSAGRRDLDNSQLSTVPGAPLLDNRIDSLSMYLEQLIGGFGSKFVFLDKNFWVCTVDVEKFSEEPHYFRHFFIPSDWMTNNEEMTIHVSAQREIMFLKRDKLVIIKRGFQNEEKVMVDSVPF